MPTLRALLKLSRHLCIDRSLPGVFFPSRGKVFDFPLASHTIENKLKDRITPHAKLFFSLRVYK